MRYINDKYTSKDKKLAVEFLFVDLGGSEGWRAYILSEIDYHRYSAFRSDAQIDVHRLTEKDDYMVCLVNRFKMNNPPIDARLTRSDDVEYLCWTKAVYDIDSLLNIASVWVDITAYYIQNGGTFEQIQKTLSRKGII